VLQQVDLRLNGQAELHEFIQVSIKNNLTSLLQLLLLTFERWLALLVVRFLLSKICYLTITINCTKWVVFAIIQHQGEGISGAQMHEILRELDVNSNGLVELDEYLQVNYFFSLQIGNFFTISVRLALKQMSPIDYGQIL